MTDAAALDEDLLYRFRGRDALLGQYAELETQTIYFARPEELNDPMDGLTDVFWRGDEVLWENFVRHYVMSFAWYFSGWLINDSENYEPMPVRGHHCEEDLGTDSLRDICAEIFDELLANEQMKRVPILLTQLPEPLRRQSLHSFLLLLHPVVVGAVVTGFTNRKLCPERFPKLGDPNKLVEFLQAMRRLPESEGLGAHSPSEIMELSGQIYSSVQSQMHMIFMSNKERKRAAKWADLLAGFPPRYIEALIRDLRHFPWRTACFSRKCTNASMWGVYAQAHRGAALVFRPKEDQGRRVLSVRGMPKTSQNSQHLEFVPVNYGKAPPPIDFFGSIGRLTRAKLENNWFRTRSGTTSPRLSEITTNLEAWQAGQLAQSPTKSCWKHFDWRHEEEERLVATSPLVDDPAPKALTYDFSQLVGLVFGMRTSDSDRLDLAKIIEKKCREHGRDDFRFFECNYWPTKGAMQVTPLNLLQFKGL